MRILIVDDEPLACARLAALLGECAGVTVIGSVGDGEAALIAIGQLQPDVLLLDINMPGLNGTALAQRLAGQARPQIIFCTAYEAHALQAFELGATDYLLKPVLLFFPKGDKKLGLQQLRSVAANGFYTATEAKVFLMRILKNEENNAEGALPVAKQLATTYPDNGCFQRFYALLAYDQGEFTDCERVSREILDKINKGMPGYEAISGRYASYFLGYLMQNRYRDLGKAKDYFQRCIVFSESTGDTDGGFYLFANANLARIATKEKDAAAAMRYYNVVLDKATRKSEMYKEAKTWLKKNGKA